MPELIDELNAVKRAMAGLEAEIRSIKETHGKGGEALAQLQSKLADLEKTRDELRDELKRIGKPPANEPTPPKPPRREREDDDVGDDDDAGFW